MAASIQTVFATLEARAWSFHGLVDKDTHRHLVPHIQRAYASLSTCAALLLEVETAAAKYVAAKATPRPVTSSQTVDAAALGSFAVAYMGFESLLESADLLSNGRDVEVFKQLGWRTVKIGAEVLVKISGIGYVKDAAEVAAAFQEAISTGNILKLRTTQARMATDLLNWIDGVSMIGLAWSFAAQLFLLGAAGKGDVSDNAVYELVLQQMAARSQTWHPSITH